MNLLEKNSTIIHLLKIMKKDEQLILLIGAGPMAVEYAKVLKELNIDFLVVGKGVKNAKRFSEVTGSKVISGGVEKFFKSGISYPKQAIVAVSEENLGKVTLFLLEHGIKSILVEKPGGLDFDEIRKVGNLALSKKAKVFVAYNRRFYASVKKGVEIIKKDGGVLSIFFDFTEPDFKIAPLIKAPEVKENWFLQNSTHVVDMAFFFTGKPKKLISFTDGSLPWHPKAAVFSGAGITTKGVLISYHADWKGPGRWGIEVVTKNHKLFFRPLEKLQIQKLGTFEIEDAEIDDELDINFKPGVYREVQSFLGNKKDLCTISEQVENLKFYQQILEGKH